MVLKLYLDLMSQPSRALYIFLRTNKINYVDCPVALRKGEHFSDEFAAVNPFKKVPAIDHDGFKLSESVAILRYLVREFENLVPNHWYPSDSKLRARVDEFLEWQHLNLRLYAAGYFRTKVIDPVLLGIPLDESKVKFLADGLEATLQQMEEIMFADGRRFLCGSEISIADLIGACEMEQPKCSGYDVFKGRPRLQAWINNVRDKTLPVYDEAHVYINKFSGKIKSNI